MDIGRYVVSVLVVGALLFLFALVLKKYRALFASNSESGIKVISVTQVGPKERLVIVHYGEREMLLGVTSAAVTKISSRRIGHTFGSGGALK